MVDEKGVVALCRCFKSAKFPLCDGAHNKHNEVRFLLNSPCTTRLPAANQPTLFRFPKTRILLL
jgi:hypothetical protein